MTTDEIKKMIADTLQGQGNQVDIGGGIPKILNAIVGLIENLPVVNKVVLTAPDSDPTGWPQDFIERTLSALAIDTLDLAGIVVRNDGIGNMKMGEEFVVEALYSQTQQDIVAIFSTGTKYEDDKVIAGSLLAITQNRESDLYGAFYMEV